MRRNSNEEPRNYRPRHETNSGNPKSGSFLGLAEGMEPRKTTKLVETWKEKDASSKTGQHQLGIALPNYRELIVGLVWLFLNWNWPYFLLFFFLGGGEPWPHRDITWFDCGRSEMGGEGFHWPKRVASLLRNRPAKVVHDVANLRANTSRRSISPWPTNIQQFKPGKKPVPSTEMSGKTRCNPTGSDKTTWKLRKPCKSR